MFVNRQVLFCFFTRLECSFHSFIFACSPTCSWTLKCYERIHSDIWHYIIKCFYLFLSYFSIISHAHCYVQLNDASNYEERSAIRKAIRNMKSGSDRKKVGSANYRRAGYQAPTTVAIPNSVTGNILPNKVCTDNISKVEIPRSNTTISYLKSKATSSVRKSDDSDITTVQSRSASSPRGSTSSYLSDQSGKNVSAVKKKAW